MNNTCGNCEHFSANDSVCTDTTLLLPRNANQQACSHWITKSGGLRNGN